MRFFCGVFCWYWYSSLCRSTSRRVCSSGAGRAGVFGGSSIAPHLHSCRFWICSLWTASVEPADVHPTVSLTVRAFYSSGSGLLWDSDLRSPRRSRLVLALYSLTPLNRDPASLHQQAPSRLPEAIIQVELQSSSFALTRLFRYWQLNTGWSLCYPSHPHKYTSQVWSQPQQLYIWLAPTEGAAI